MRIRLLIAAVLAVAVPAMATPLAQLIDFAQCKVTPGGAVTAEGGNVVITVRAGDSPDTGAELRFRQPLLTSGKDRFVMEARADELTRAYLCQSQTVFIGNDGSSLTYEPDLSFTPTWSLREVLLADMPAGLPTAVTGLRLTFWSPYNAGREMRFLMRRLEFQSTTEMAAELRLSPATRKPLPMKPVAAAPADQRWVNLGPGGGGWFRDIAISPHDGTCFVGGDVGGVYRSRDRGRTWTVCNQGLSNLYVNCVAFHPTDPHTLYAGTNGGPARSTDGGDTWKMLLAGLPPLRTFGQDAPISSLLVDQTNPRRVWAGLGYERDNGNLGDDKAGCRVLLSEDAGDHWTIVALPLGEAAKAASVLSLIQHPQEPNVLLASSPFGAYRSDDRGVSWTRLPVSAGYRFRFLALSPTQPATLL
ncbi:MAG: hypothetical protein WCP21_13365, partial [Armatimonadota bacterium]